MNAVAVAVLAVAVAAIGQNSFARENDFKMESAEDSLLSHEHAQKFSAIEEKFKSMKANKKREEQDRRRFMEVNPAQKEEIIGALRLHRIDVADIKIAVATIEIYSVGRGSSGFMHRWYAETENSMCGGILKIKHAGIFDATRVYESNTPDCVEKKSDRRADQPISVSGLPRGVHCSRATGNCYIGNVAIY